MKYKRYILVLLIAILFDGNKVFALNTCENNDCYYMSNEKDTYLCYNPTKKKVTISLTGVNSGKKDPLINMNGPRTDNKKYTGMTVPAVGQSCPQYLVYRYHDGLWFFNSEGIWGFNDSTLANKFFDASNSVENMQAYIANKTTKISYDSSLIVAYGIGTSNYSGTDVTVDCNAIFGSKSDPESIRYLVDEVLQYPRIIVPLLVIVFGMVDLARAVISSKEDDMKKAQKKFVSRLVIGVAFFFIPVFVDIIMSLADIVWEGLGYTSCNV